jgi:hypothetical protein
VIKIFVEIAAAIVFIGDVPKGFPSQIAGIM